MMSIQVQMWHGQQTRFRGGLIVIPLIPSFVTASTLRCELLAANLTKVKTPSVRQGNIFGTFSKGTAHTHVGIRLSYPTNTSQLVTFYPSLVR